MTAKKTYKLGLLLTGNEILSGDIVDNNSVFMTKELAEAGLSVKSKLTVGDDIDSIVEAISFLAKTCDLTIVNGGLGATVDDKTAEAASLASGRKLEENSFALKNLEDFLVTRGFSDKYGESDKPAYRNFWRKQTSLPEGAETLPNPVGIAIGFKMKIHDSVFYFTPGVPSEMRIMLTQSIIPDILSDLSVDFTRLTKSSFQVFGLGESQIQAIIDRVSPPERRGETRLGFRAWSSYVEVKLSSREGDESSALRSMEKEVRRSLSDYAFSRGAYLPEIAARLLKEKNATLSLAESCTGGTLASLLTGVPGVSASFAAGLVTYSNRSKTSLLGVPDDLIERYGAVSSEVAAKMVEGALKAVEADYALAVTGIAGPDGGSPEKPVGTVYIAWGDKTKTKVRKFIVKSDRIGFQRLVAITALDLLRRHLLKLPTDIPYFFDRLTRKNF